MGLDIRTELQNQEAILYFTGVLDIATVDLIQASVSQLSNMRGVSFDFAKVTFVDSTGIGTLSTILRKFISEGVRVTIKNIPASVFEIFDILGLPEIFGEEVFQRQA